MSPQFDTDSRATENHLVKTPEVNHLELTSDWPNEAGFQTTHEERTPVELQTLGSIPAYAAGTLYRTGPGSYKVQGAKNGDFNISHWFDGFGYVHRFQIIADGDAKVRVFYNSRRQVDQLVDSIKKTGKYDQVTFGQKRDPCIGVFGKVMSVFQAAQAVPKNAQMVNNCVTMRLNLPGIASAKPEPKEPKGHSTGLRNMYVLSDTSQLKEIDPATLEPMGFTDQKRLHPSLKGPLSAAHAMSDPETGDVFNYNLAFGPITTYKVFTTSAATGKTKILASFTAPGAYIHSFFLTEDYVILAVWNSRYRAMGIQILVESNVVDAISSFDSSQPTKWFVVDRRHGRGVVSVFESPACFCFHSVNAWQETDAQGKVNIICDYIEYDNLDILYATYYSNMLSDSKTSAKSKGQRGLTRPTLARYKFPNIGSKTLSISKSTRGPPAERLLTIPESQIGDLPTINPRYEQKPHRYVYGIVNRGYSNFLDGISKVDTLTQSVIYWDNPRGHTPGEAIFIPRPEGTEEDDGVLLSVVLDGFKRTSYLVCLDARNLREMGRAECEWAVGMGFHGVYLK